MRRGEKLVEQIDRAIHLHDRLLVVLSANSIESEWVPPDFSNWNDRDSVERAFADLLRDLRAEVQ